MCYFKYWSFIKLEEICDIQFGICTNRDKIYVHKTKNIEDNDKLVLFNGYKIEKDILKNIIKGSTLNDDEKMIIFPYLYNKIKNKYEIMEEEYLKENYPFAYKYLLNYNG
ncbi:MAG: hypothetical protein GX889_03070 [Clostridiales bacterium]|nr:hypothetical protein [Clostridiales bacterium]